MRLNRRPLHFIWNEWEKSVPFFIVSHVFLSNYVHSPHFQHSHTCVQYKCKSKKKKNYITKSNNMELLRAILCSVDCYKRKENCFRLTYQLIERQRHIFSIYLCNKVLVQSCQPSDALLCLKSLPHYVDYCNVFPISKNVLDSSPLHIRLQVEIRIPVEKSIKQRRKRKKNDLKFVRNSFGFLLLIGQRHTRNQMSQRRESMSMVVVYKFMQMKIIYL